MGKEKIIYTADYSPEDYLFAIATEWVNDDVAPSFIDKSDMPDSHPRLQKIQYRIILPEFGIEHTLSTCQFSELEKRAYEKIREEIARLKENEKPLPIPMKFCTDYSGRITLRVSPETHKRLYVESLITKTTINSLIERKLNTKS